MVSYRLPNKKWPKKSFESLKDISSSLKRARPGASFASAAHVISPSESDSHEKTAPSESMLNEGVEQSEVSDDFRAQVESKKVLAFAEFLESKERWKDERRMVRSMFFDDDKSSPQGFKGLPSFPQL